MMRNLLATMLLSAGVPMLTAGDETARTQRGNNNAYCLDDETAWVSWDHQPWQRDLYGWTRALLAIRRTHPVLRHDAFFEGRPAHADGVKDLAWFGPDGQEVTAEQWFDHDRHVLGMYVSGVPGGEGVDATPVLVVLNTGPEPARVVLPGLPWAESYDTLLDTSDEQPAAGPSHPSGAAVEVAPHSLHLLAAHR
jgi:glycogen operon protein